MSRHLRYILVGGGGVLVLIVLIVVLTFARAFSHSQQGAPMGGGSVRAIPDLASLVHQSDLVVVATVVSSGASAAGGPRPTSVATISVDSVVRGSASPGQQPAVLEGQVEDGPVLQTGERYVMFLVQAGPGRYYPAGGAQGVLSVDASDAVHPLNPGAPATHVYDGHTLTSFIADVAAIP